MNHNFTVEEVNLICIFAGESRSEVIKDMERALQYQQDYQSSLLILLLTERKHRKDLLQMVIMLKMMI